MKKITARLCALIMVVILSLSLCACSLNGGLTVGRYVDSVKNDVHEIVNITRDMKKQQEKLEKNLKQIIFTLN
jgi:hypothetical protein